MRRTVRLGLWTGEEEGLLGSRAYVKEHFADPDVMQLKPEHAKLDAYYNIDNGTGKIRGVYLQGNEAVAPIFAEVDGAVPAIGHDHADAFEIRAARIIFRSMPWGCPASNSFRTRSTTTRARTIRIWMCTNGFRSRT